MSLYEATVLVKFDTWNSELEDGISWVEDEISNIWEAIRHTFSKAESQSLVSNNKVNTQKEAKMKNEVCWGNPWSLVPEAQIYPVNFTFVLVHPP